MKKTAVKFSAAVLATALLSTSLEAAVWFVRPEGRGDGGSWENALGSVRSAVTRAAAGDSIWIAEGTYRESFVVGRELSLYGGFAGGESALEERNPRAHPVVFTHEEKGPIVTVGYGVGKVTLDGLVLRGEDWSSEGIYLLPETDVVIRNVRLEEARGFGSGLDGAIHCSGFCSVVFDNVTVRGSFQTGIFCGSGSNILMTHCRIEENLGGALTCVGSHVEISNSLILGNGDRYGAVLSCTDTHAVYMTRCTILGNISWDEPGLIRCRNASPHLKNCILAYNAGELFSVDEDSHPEVVYSSFRDIPVLPGEGNITADPAFEGWGKEIVFVDSNASEQGDGSAESPYRDLDEAFAGFSFALRPESPCRGAGEGGTDMGADFGDPPAGLPRAGKIVMYSRNSPVSSTATTFEPVRIPGSMPTTRLGPKGAAKSLFSTFLANTSTASRSDRILSSTRISV